MTAPTDSSDHARLKAAGLRITAPRLSVLAAVREHPHCTVDVVARYTRDRLGAVSTQAVYDVLRAFTDAGLVRRIEPAGSPAVYEARIRDNHHHLVCRVCGAISDVDCEVGAAPCLTPPDAAGFEIDEAEVVFWGRCTNCQADNRKTESPSISFQPAVKGSH